MKISVPRVLFMTAFGLSAILVANVPARSQALVASSHLPPATLSVPPSGSTGTVVVFNAPPPTQEEVGDALMVHQRYQAAIAAYKEVTPPTAAVLNKLGIAYQMMFSLDLARNAYQQALRMEPKDTRAMNNLATLYDVQKDFKPAEKLYRRALALEPTSALLYKNLGTNLIAQRQMDKGAKAYRRALELDERIFDHTVGLRIDNPSSVQQRGAINYLMARSCAHAGQANRALELLRSALNEGYTNARKIAADDEFAILRPLPAYQKLLEDFRH